MVAEVWGPLVPSAAGLLYLKLTSRCHSLTYGASPLQRVGVFHLIYPMNDPSCNCVAKLFLLSLRWRHINVIITLFHRQSWNMIKEISINIYLVPSLVFKTVCGPEQPLKHLRVSQSVIGIRVSGHACPTPHPSLLRQIFLVGRVAH